MTNEQLGSVSGEADCALRVPGRDPMALCLKDGVRAPIDLGRLEIEGRGEGLAEYAMEPRHATGLECQ